MPLSVWHYDFGTLSLPAPSNKVGHQGGALTRRSKKPMFRQCGYQMWLWDPSTEQERGLQKGSFFLFPKPDDSASLLPCSSETINQCVNKDLYNWELLLFLVIFLNLGWNVEENSQRWGMAGAESPVPWSECSGWLSPRHLFCPDREELRVLRTI